MTKEETIIDVSKQFRNLQVQYEKVIKCHKQLQKELREETVESVRLKAQYDKVVEQNKQLQAENRRLLDIINQIGTFDFTECNKTCPNNVGKIIKKLLKGTENDR